MNRRITIALATAAAVVLAGVSPVHAETPADPGKADSTVTSVGEQAQATDQEKDTAPDQDQPEQPSDEDTTKDGSSGSSSSKDPDKTSSENLSSTLLEWNKLSPEAEETFKWINVIVGILTAITQALVIIVPIIKALS
ncbi:hypothetical protein [Corynebacterium cystitidis]|uniref:hypothetical protein n=1 Tax=Corynebacterium cystitidis TaxID=35757 RepID=UPI00211EEAA0|nr:hypothetical protein [Corynebacterium cystitidis]